MKKYISHLLAGSCLLTMAACVDLDQAPKSFITEEEYIEIPQNITTVELAATGLYNSMWGGNYGFCCRMMRIDCSADQMMSSPKPNNVLDYIISLNPSIGANTADWDTSWANFWNVITGANKLITGTPIPSDAAEAKRYKAVLGEARFMRALSYFYLVRIYGEVPAVLTPADALAPQGRASVSDIYNRIILPDLQDAISTLPEKSRSGFSSTPSRWAAKALLADVYMNMAGWPLKLGKEYYAKAVTETLDIINNSGLQLTSNYSDLWKEASKTDANEHLFAIHNSVAQKNASQYGKSFYPRDFYPKAGWADYYANPDFMNKYPNDDRKKFNYMTEWETAKGKKVQWTESMDKLPCIAKYQNYNQGVAGSSAQSNGITPIYRYADVLLMYAEASNLATGVVNDKALWCLNEVQRRAHSILFNGRDTGTFDTAVFNERGWEFLAEFKRWFDLVRREKVAEAKPKVWSASLFKANNHYYFPIPSDQIKMTGWSNNTGY